VILSLSFSFLITTFVQAQGDNSEQFRPAGRDGEVQLRRVQADGHHSQHRVQAQEGHGHGQQQPYRLQHVHQVRDNIEYKNIFQLCSGSKPARIFDFLIRGVGYIFFSL
jgi:hypothetical protein